MWDCLFEIYALPRNFSGIQKLSLLQTPYDTSRLVEAPTFLARIRPFRSGSRHYYPFLQSIFLVHLCKSFRSIYHLNNVDPILERTDWECDECNKVWIRKRNAAKVT